MLTAMREHGLIEDGEDGLALTRFGIMRDTENGIDCDTRLPVACTVSISSDA